jgi:hypothetical protein
MSKSVYRGYAVDKEKEELDYISRNLGGVGDILEKLRIDIIGASQIPHTILFGRVLAALVPLAEAKKGTSPRCLGITKPLITSALFKS